MGLLRRCSYQLNSDEFFYTEKPKQRRRWVEAVGGGWSRGLRGSLCQIQFDFRLNNNREREMLVHSLLLSIALSFCCSAHGQKTAQTAL